MIQKKCYCQPEKAAKSVSGGDQYKAQSAGIEQGKLNPVVAQAMVDIGIDVSSRKQ